MVKVKLNPKYPNDFITLQSGHVFYRKENSLQKEENVHDVSEENWEAKRLIESGKLILVDNEKIQNTIPKAQTIKETKTVKNDEEIEKIVGQE